MPQPDRAALTQPFAEEELLTFSGRGGKTMTYIQDETVMDRLDAAFGIGGWQVLVEPISIDPGIVKVRLGVNVDGWVWYEDFGYPNRDGGQALKEAVSDGIRRCGRYLGIARDLYRDDAHATVHSAAQNGQSAPVPLRAVAAPPRSSTAVPDDFGDLDFDSLTTTRPVAPLTGTQAVTDRVELSEGENWCPVHGLAWVLKPAGISKTGAPYDPFWSCSSKDKPYCREKPTVQWVKAHTPVPVG